MLEIIPVFRKPQEFTHTPHAKACAAGGNYQTDFQQFVSSAALNCPTKKLPLKNYFYPLNKAPFAQGYSEPRSGLHLLTPSVSFQKAGIWNDRLLKFLLRDKFLDMGGLCVTTLL